MKQDHLVRINKLFSELGICSRREADKLIASKQVTINGKLAATGSKVSSQDEVRLNGELVSGEARKLVYIAFNKPPGIVCTTDTKKEKNNIIDYIGHEERIFPIGRLDKDSQGLILLTSDGNIVNKILRAENKHEKEYLVTVKKAISKSFIQNMSKGVPVLGQTTKRCKIEQLSKYQFKITLTQGLNRQIRRMCEHLENKVSHLERIRIMNIKLDVPLGKWRKLNKGELNDLNDLLQSSNMTS